MTRKELATGIYRFYKAQGTYPNGYNDEKGWVKLLLEGVGALGYQSKEKLQRWYDNLIEE